MTRNGETATAREETWTGEATACVVPQKNGHGSRSETESEPCLSQESVSEMSVEQRPGGRDRDHETGHGRPGGAPIENGSGGLLLVSPSYIHTQEYSKYRSSTSEKEREKAEKIRSIVDKKRSSTHLSRSRI